MTGPIARVEKVDLRTVWPLERHDFSQWLIENIDFLNEHLPFEVDPESLKAEASAGAFSVDVVGDATSPDSGEPFKVIIENQLEPTDHKHLGQIMTYLAAFDARAAIWISAGARPEHARAVQWLNDESNIDAWLFDVEVIRIQGSSPAPLLRRIIAPSALSAKVKQERRDTALVKGLRQDYWQVVLPLIQREVAALDLFWGREPSGNPYVSQKASGPAAAYWQVWVTSAGSWLCLRFHGEEKAEARHYFDQLQEQRAELEEAFGQRLKWDPLPGSMGAVIRWDNPVKGGFQSDPDTWPAAGENLARAMRRFVEVFQGPVAALREYPPEVASEEGAD